MHSLHELLGQRQLNEKFIPLFLTNHHLLQEDKQQVIGTIILLSIALRNPHTIQHYGEGTGRDDETNDKCNNARKPVRYCVLVLHKKCIWVLANRSNQQTQSYTRKTVLIIRLRFDTCKPERCNNPNTYEN